MEQTVRVWGQLLNVFAGTDIRSTFSTTLRHVRYTAKLMAKNASAKCSIIYLFVSDHSNFEFFSWLSRPQVPLQALMYRARPQRQQKMQPRQRLPQQLPRLPEQAPLQLRANFRRAPDHVPIPRGA